MGWTRKIAGLIGGVAIIGLMAGSVWAQAFNSGSTGADGAFEPTCTPTPCTVEVTLPQSGVFNATTVNIAPGVTVTFTKNLGNTPVTILATGDVTIAGIINVNAKSAQAFGVPGRGGPGGFDGGIGGNPTVAPHGTAGLGPGGGGGSSTLSVNAGNGGFGGAGDGTLGGKIYGTHLLIPLIGGSGGGGQGSGTTTAGGGGGGGAGSIMIASSGKITFVTGGRIEANGGTGGSSRGGGGSGGGIRLIANQITGNGTVQALGGSSGPSASGGGGVGRIRFEAFEITLTGTVSPPPSPALPGPVSPPAGTPTLQITAVAGVSPPANPQGNFLALPDITLAPTVTNPVAVSLAAANIPLGTTIEVTVIPEGGNQTTVLSTPLSGTEASSTASASVTLANGVSVISAVATFAVSTASLGNSMLIGGEEVKWIHVGATYGGESTLAYITASGKEVRLH